MITILIPAFNRPDHLNRTLSYYNDCEISYDIIVADSSSEENKQVNKKFISSFSNINISYMDEYPSGFDMYHEIADALNHVNTEYCVFAADDDFTTPKGIKQSIDFLEKNPDFAIAQGYYIFFYVGTDKIGRQHFYWTPSYSRESNSFSDPKNRLSHQFQLSIHALPTCHAVHRTDIMRMAYEESIKYTDDNRFGEMLPSLLALIYGKAKCVDVLYSVREWIPMSSGNISPSLIDFIRDGTYDYKYKRFRECLSTHLSKEGQLDIEESKKVIDNAISAYVSASSSKQKRKKSDILKQMSDILEYFNLPDWMDGRIRALYRRIDPLPSPVEISPSLECYDDLSKIREHVLSHSKIYLR